MAEPMERTKSSGEETASVVVVSRPESDTGKGDNSTATQATTEETSEKAATKEGEDKKSDDEKKKEDKVLVGTIADSIDLYAKYDENGDRSWSSSPPDGVEEAAENEETAKYAILARKKKPKESDSKNLVLDSIVVQSPYLKTVLTEIFDEYPGITTRVSRLTFHAPFECFVHRWDAFVAAKDDTQYDEKTREHIAFLYKVMHNELQETIRLRQDYFEQKVVSWDHVWTLFPPGCYVLGSKAGRPVAARFDDGGYIRTQCGKQYQLNAQCIDWDGNDMGWTDCDQRIPQYRGVRPFHELPCYPIDYHPEPDKIKEVLKARGRVFEGFAGFHYKFYNGPALYHPETNPDKTRIETVQSRIVIDGQNWEKSNPENMVMLNTVLHFSTKAVSRRNSISSDASGGSGYDAQGEQQPDTTTDDEVSRAPMTDDQLLLCSPIVRGYSLTNKRWMEFFVDKIDEIVFNDKAFDSLVLQEEHKELILAFAQSQVKYKHAFDDIISGKGKGIIMLLSGGPGIGKTLTAESVAEEMRVPLYIMSAGDLGTEAREVEENLGAILGMVANWNAVLLLDECDVFLEARTAQDMERNRIVGIFLRLLEYYQGCLFLTTNRVQSMDPAFQSRIHLAIEYPPLDEASRVAIWRGFLGRTVSLRRGQRGDDAHEVTADETAQLSKLELNGRQIKNVLKMANLLSCQKEEKLRFEHIRKVLKVEGRSL
ncbi:P-loop containing nucleoside triphosphate hydrolase protein [Emericellopsis atlantica]|uniref:P-loop containing nucleoside triphosphate hydrolase protein n=1 Tax=Emericellopsis atlantica TaxID=2614577 RepID=A0A9P7ZI81_9HYPO|nr:P-loop containing nucleoside triphosphate hydrolase protein [Emericellopsis atlantica]KAG9252262.1 P-loop containing nucleoside triphosphate hydrolase protein [Emericellopsis atlantica]